MHLNIQIRIAATDLRKGDRFCSNFFCSLSENATVKEILRLVNIWPSYCQNKKGALFMTYSVVVQVLKEACDRMSRCFT